MRVIPGSADYENQQVRTLNRVSGTHRILAASEPRRSCLREAAGHHAGRVFGTHRIEFVHPTRWSRRCDLQFGFGSVGRPHDALHPGAPLHDEEVVVGLAAVVTKSEPPEERRAAQVSGGIEQRPVV
jgi:hypothetical protein